MNVEEMHVKGKGDLIKGELCLKCREPSKYKNVFKDVIGKFLEIKKELHLQIKIAYFTLGKMKGEWSTLRYILTVTDFQA